MGLALVLMSCSMCQALSSSQAPIETGKFLKGCCGQACAYSTGRLSTPSGVDDAFEWFKDEIEEQFEDMGESQESGLKKWIPTLNKRFESQNVKIREILTGYGAANEDFKNTLQFGERSKAYITYNRSKYLTGKSASKRFSERLMTNGKDYSRSCPNKNEIAKRLNAIKKSNINLGDLFLDDTTLEKKKLSNLLSIYNTTIDPFPATNRTQNEASLKKAYNTIRKIKRIQIDLVQNVLADILTGYAPTVPVPKKIAELAQKNDNTMPQLVDGRISPVAYLGLMVRLRFASDEFRTGKRGIHTMTRTGLLRELASVQALRLAIERRQLRRANQMAYLEAIKSANMANEDSVELLKNYENIVSSD